MEDRDRGFGRRNFAPVNVGDELDVTIDSVGEKGDGLAKINGFVIFVPGTKQGDKIRIKVIRVLRKVGFGEVLGAGSAKSSEDASSENEGTEETSEENNETEQTEDEASDESSEDSEEETTDQEEEN